MCESCQATHPSSVAAPPRLVPFPFPRPNRQLRGIVFRRRPGHWWWEVIDGTPKRENVVTVGFADTQAEALRLCLLALRIESGPLVNKVKMIDPGFREGVV